MLSANKQKKGAQPMELDERKKKILNVIIRNYMETGEPVGSRTISKDPDLKLSSATIRNEIRTAVSRQARARRSSYPWRARGRNWRAR